MTMSKLGPKQKHYDKILLLYSGGLDLLEIMKKILRLSDKNERPRTGKKPL